ncbi:MAG TPA: hypothetical protein VFR96_08200 [Povalibacter sp.]|jgi:hypothetical protein|nr:hypothetical protein [Povalibacter sp.]
MSSAIADSVLAATHKLVDQAMRGQWQDVPKTVQERRVLLDRLTAGASSADLQWLTALRQAMAESDAAIAQMAAVDAPQAAASIDGTQPTAASSGSTVDTTLDMIRQGR